MWNSCIDTLYDDLYNDRYHISLNFSYYFPLVSRDFSGPLPSCISAHSQVSSEQPLHPHLSFLLWTTDKLLTLEILVTGLMLTTLLDFALSTIKCHFMSISSNQQSHLNSFHVII